MRAPLVFRLLASLGFLSPLLLIGATPDAPFANPPLQSLRAEHPRLLVTRDTWPALRDRAAADPDFRPLLDAAIAAARARLDAAPPVRELQGRRLLFVSRRVLADAIWLSLAYHVTGERAFLDTAERNLLAAAAFTDWNPDHFLDVAEMTAGLALGYDWLHDDLAPATRASLRAAIAEKGIRPGLDPAAKTNWWHVRRMNWNQICLGGLSLGALAIAEDEPALAAEMLERLRVGHVHGLAPYEPDGVYPEGPSYWRYGTSYTVFTLAALRTALGSETPLPPTPAFLAGARVQTLLTAPSGLPYNFADGGGAAAPDPLLFWFADRLGDPSLLAGQRVFYLPFVAPKNAASLDPAHLFALLHWQTPPAVGASGWTAWQSAGVVPLAIFRGPDRKPGPFYLALKGGSPSGPHAHMDGGSFVFELDGVRWAHDLGMQEYHALEKRGVDLWNARPGGGRWTVFRYTNFAHNTLTLDGRLHDPLGAVALFDFSATAGKMGVSANLGPVLNDGAARAVRRFLPRPDARGLRIEDRLDGLRPGARVRWTLVTTARVELRENGAILRQNGRELALRFSAPCAVVLALGPAKGAAEWDAPADGFSLLTAETPAPDSGAVNLDAEFLAP